MKLKKIGLSLCLTAMASVVFNIGAAACTVPAASGTGASVRQGTQNSYTQRQVQFPYAVGVGAAQKQQSKGSAYKVPAQQPKSPAFWAPSPKQRPKSPASKAPSQKQQPKSPTAEELAKVQAQRQQINTLNAQVLKLKAQARQDIGKICADLVRVAFDPAVRQSDDYKAIVNALNKVKIELAAAEKINYCSKLASVKGKNDASTLSGVITQLNTKISGLTAVVDELGGVLTKADALVKQELAGRQSSQPMSSQPAESQPASSQPTSSQPADQQAAQQAWQQFAAQADAKKKTIDGNTQKIASVNKNCQDVVNKIVATAAANKDVLANQGSGMADIVVQLGAVRTNLAAESNGKISEALKAYAEALKKKDYDGALAQLDAIIGIQNSRISAVQSALSQLQSALSSLQNLVATAAASSASSAVSSQAA